MIEQLLKHRSSLVKMLVKQGMVFLVSKVPFLAFGPLSWIISQILQIYLDKLLVAGIKKAEIELSEYEREKLAKQIESLFSVYDHEMDEQTKEKIENEIVDNARSLIKLNKLRSITKST